jgi:Tol biopolymer transport system component
VKPIRGGLLSGVVTAFLMLALYPASSWATYPGANGRIAYSESEGLRDDSEIITNAPTGGDPVHLTNNSIDDQEPSWSATGRRIAFTRWDGQDWEIWTMRAGGTGQRQVTDDRGHEGAPYFSPGGGRIVMATYQAISTVRTDGTDLRQLVSGLVSEPEYSPGGKRIVFAGLPDGFHKSGIWTVRRDGSHLRRVTRSPQEEDGFDSGPDWRPDGRRILYARCIASSEGAVTAASIPFARTAPETTSSPTPVRSRRPSTPPPGVAWRSDVASSTTSTRPEPFAPTSSQSA